jgi:pilus assembly protein CpaB
VADVGGFILPGDRVDIVLTQPRERKGPITDIVLLNVRVLGVDQLADQRADKPSVVKAVTLEVDEIGGQKLALASRVGTLALLLRKAGDKSDDMGRELTQLDLTHDVIPTEHSHFITILITRPSKEGTSRDEYSVPKEDFGPHAALMPKEKMVRN